MKKLALAMMLLASPLMAQWETPSATGVSGARSEMALPTWTSSHKDYVKNYWHRALETQPPHRMFATAETTPPLVPTDVYILGGKGSNWQYGVTNHYDIGACVERELHDGQWLAGPCKDILYLLHVDAAGNLNKFAHLGGAVMYNSGHGNASYQIRVGVNAGSLGAVLSNGISIVAPNLNLTPPPFVSYMANAVTFDYSAGYRPVHDSSVNGNFTHGPQVMVNVPIATTFEWLVSGL